MKREKMQGKSKISAAGFYALVCVMMVALLLAGCSGSNEQAKADETPAAAPTDAYEITVETFAAYTEPPLLPPVEVVMDDYTFTYAGEKAVVIRTEETDKGLEFFAELTAGKAPVFTVVFNSQEGDIVTVLTSESGAQIPVAFLMYEMPSGLSEDDQLSFMMAQEAVNEIVDSVKLK